MTKENRLRGKVARILNERELVINLGSTSKVDPGMRFAVLAEPATVTDPDTGAELGIVRRTKVRVEVRSVEPKMSICRTYETKLVGGSAGGALGSSLVLRQLFEEARPAHQVPVTLRAKESDFLPPLDPDESYVQIGDIVEEVVEAD